MSGMNPIEPPGLLELLFGCVRGGKSDKNNSSKATTVAQNTMPTNQHQPPARPLPSIPVQGGQDNPQKVGTIAAQNLPAPQTYSPSPYYPAQDVAMQPVEMRLIGAASDIQDKFEAFYNNPSYANLKSFNEAILDYPANNEPFPYQYMATILPSFTDLLIQHAPPQEIKLYDALEAYSNLIMMYNSSIAPACLERSDKDTVSKSNSIAYVHNSPNLNECIKKVLDHYRTQNSIKSDKLDSPSDLQNLYNYGHEEQITILSELTTLSAFQGACYIFNRNLWRVTPELENKQTGMIGVFKSFEGLRKVSKNWSPAGYMMCVRSAANSANYNQYNGNDFVLKNIIGVEMDKMHKMYAYGLRIKSLKFMIEAAIRTQNRQKIQIMVSLLKGFKDGYRDVQLMTCYSFTRDLYIHDMILAGLAAIQACHPFLQNTVSGVLNNPHYNIGTVSSFLQDIVAEKTQQA